jgi:hypothetical protein
MGLGGLQTSPRSRLSLSRRSASRDDYDVSDDLCKLIVITSVWAILTGEMFHFMSVASATILGGGLQPSNGHNTALFADLADADATAQAHGVELHEAIDVGSLASTTATGFTVATAESATESAEEYDVFEHTTATIARLNPITDLTRSPALSPTPPPV